MNLWLVLGSATKEQQLWLVLLLDYPPRGGDMWIFVLPCYFIPTGNCHTKTACLWVLYTTFLLLNYLWSYTSAMRQKKTKTRVRVRKKVGDHRIDFFSPHLLKLSREKYWGCLHWSSVMFLVVISDFNITQVCRRRGGGWNNHSPLC